MELALAVAVLLALLLVELALAMLLALLLVELAMADHHAVLRALAFALQQQCEIPDHHVVLRALALQQQCDDPDNHVDWHLAADTDSLALEVLLVDVD